MGPSDCPFVYHYSYLVSESSRFELMAVPSAMEWLRFPNSAISAVNRHKTFTNSALRFPASKINLSSH